jgi:hypothetical protein
MVSSVGDIETFHYKFKPDRGLARDESQMLTTDEH